MAVSGLARLRQNCCTAKDYRPDPERDLAFALAIDHMAASTDAFGSPVGQRELPFLSGSCPLEVLLAKGSPFTRVVS